MRKRGEAGEGEGPLSLEAASEKSTVAMMSKVPVGGETLDGMGHLFRRFLHERE